MLGRVLALEGRAERSMTHWGGRGMEESIVKGGACFSEWGGR